MTAIVLTSLEGTGITHRAASGPATISRQPGESRQSDKRTSCRMDTHGPIIQARIPPGSAG